MRVFLTCSFALKRRPDGLGSGDQVLIGDIGCRPWASVPRVDKLDGARRSRNSDRRKIKQARLILDLGLFQSQSVTFHGSKNLFNSPP
jgi:hypothetical protein